MISYTQADVGRHTYTVSETKGSQPGISYDTRTYTVVVDVTGDGKGNLTATAQGGADALNFTNTYTTTNATAVITGRKVLKNRDLAKGEFGFELKSEDGTLIQSVTNDVNGGITFAPISYTVSGITTLSSLSQLPNTLPSRYSSVSGRLIDLGLKAENTSDA